MKVGFVNAIVSEYANSFPMGLVSLCTILSQYNVECKIIDFREMKDRALIDKKRFAVRDIALFAQIIEEGKFDIVSFYTMSNSFHISILTAKALRDIAPDVKIVFAGPQASVCAQEILTNFPFIDFVSIGEGERTIYNTVINILNGSPQNCENLLYRRGNAILSTPVAPLVNNLDDIPFLDYSFYPSILDQERIPIEVGRGCPFSCTFCSTKGFWNQKYRLKSSKRIIQEVVYLRDNYHITHFSFEHDSLTANRKAIVELCNALIDQNVGITWGCSSRVDMLDEKMIALLYNAGCRSIFMGIETGSPNIQKKIKKNLDLSKIEKTISLLERYGINTTCSFMYGFPDEQEDDLGYTFSLISKLIRLNVGNIQMHRLVLLRGTELYKEHGAELACLNLDSNFNAGGSGLYFEQLITEYPDLFPHFYKVKSNYATNYIEIFINCFLKAFIKHYHFTYDYLIKKYYKNLYKFYLDLIPSCMEIEKDIYKVLNGEISNVDFEVSLVKTLKRTYFSSQVEDQFVKCLFQFEVDFYCWANSSERKARKEYSFDLLDYLSHPEGSAPKSNNKKAIIFEKSDGHLYVKSDDAS